VTPTRKETHRKVMARRRERAREWLWAQKDIIPDAGGLRWHATTPARGRTSVGGVRRVRRAGPAPDPAGHRPGLVLRAPELVQGGGHLGNHVRFPGLPVLPGADPLGGGGDLRVRGAGRGHPRVLADGGKSPGHRPGGRGPALPGRRGARHPLWARLHRPTSGPQVEPGDVRPPRARPCRHPSGGVRPEACGRGGERLQHRAHAHGQAPGRPGGPGHWALWRRGSPRSPPRPPRPAPIGPARRKRARS
jgi:hypothetical protein